MDKAQIVKNLEETVQSFKSIYRLRLLNHNMKPYIIIA